jgi:hypothetical protein
MTTAWSGSIPPIHGCSVARVTCAANFPHRPVLVEDAAAERATRTGAAPEMLDERTLRDVGSHYPDIEKIVRYEDPHTW